MDRFTRIFLTHRILRGTRRPVPRQTLEAELECSTASVKRIIAEMRDFLGAPIEYDREANGYYYADHGDHPYELPGLWFSTDELLALATLQSLLAGVGPGLLDASLQPLRKRVEALLSSEALGLGELPNRVRLLPMGARRPHPDRFRHIAAALLRRQRLRIDYHARSRDQITVREVSPQRLVNYRHNWYLDAWCHTRDALRTFAVERIRRAQALDTAARRIPDADLNAHFAASYGIFAGPATEIALLRFEPEYGRWVADEEWHPEQQGQWLADGRYELRLPYGDPTELILDLLRYGPGVEVIAPGELRAMVKERLERATARYRSTGSENEPGTMLEPAGEQIDR